LGIPLLARAVRLAAACGFLVALAGPPAHANHLIYATTADGGLFAIDVDNGLALTTLRPDSSGYNAQSVAPGDTANSLYVQKNDGVIDRFDLTLKTSEPTGGRSRGYAFGEGLDGSWYINRTAENSLDRFDPGGSATPSFMGYGAQDYDGDLATANDGQMWGTTRDKFIVHVNKSNGSQTIVASYTTTIPPGPNPTLPSFWGLAFTTDGRLFGGSPTGHIYQISLIDGTQTYVGFVDLGINDLASERAAPCQLPQGTQDICYQRHQAGDCQDGGPNDLCRPTQLNYDPATGQYTAKNCDCVDLKDCFIDLQYDPFHPGPVPVCLGVHCPGTNSPCELTATDNNDGTFTYDCCPKNAPVVIDLTTGVDDATSGLIPITNPDDTWTLTCIPGGVPLPPYPATVVSSQGGWSTLPNSRWISFNASAGPPAPGDYCYESCFCLNDGFQNASLSFDILADDSAEVFLNSTSVCLTPPLATGLPATHCLNQTLFQAGNNCIKVVVHEYPLVVTGFDLVGQVRADNAQCHCEPLPDGSGCQKTICPDPNDLCKPTQVVYDPSSIQPTVTKCDCVNADQCSIVILPCLDLFCEGSYCPLTGMPCPMTPTATFNPDGTTTYECCPKAFPDGWIQDYFPCDTGVEPDLCPGATPMWESEDIWVRNKKDGGLTHQNPIYPGPNYVYVKLRNRGNCDVSGEIKVYWAKASAGLIWDPSLGVNNSNWLGHSSITGDMIPGPVTVTNLAPTLEYVAQFTWSPPAPIPTGHFCLLARFLYAPATYDPMHIAETKNIWDNTHNNNNIAWKNVIVVTGNVTMSGDGFLVRNVKDLAANVDLVFNAAGGGGGIPFLDGGSVRVALTPEMFNNWQGAGGLGQGIIANPNDSSVSLTSPLAKIQGIPMGAYEAQLVTMYFTPDGGISPPAFQRFVVSQFSDGQTTPDGGVTFEFRFATGACCDQRIADPALRCQNDIPQSLCPIDDPRQVQWYMDTRCDEIDCPEHTGGCCDEDTFGGCEDNVPASACNSKKSVWYKDTPCTQIECTHNPIPTVSAWGLVVLTLLLLIGAKAYFGRRQSAAA
jgi:hypothetical protein